MTISSTLICVLPKEQGKNHELVKEGPRKLFLLNPNWKTITLAYGTGQFSLNT